MTARMTYFQAHRKRLFSYSYDLLHLGLTAVMFGHEVWVPSQVEEGNAFSFITILDRRDGLRQVTISLPDIPWRIVRSHSIKPSKQDGSSVRVWQKPLDTTRFYIEQFYDPTFFVEQVEKEIPLLWHQDHDRWQKEHSYLVPYRFEFLNAYEKHRTAPEKLTTP